MSYRDIQFGESSLRDRMNVIANCDAVSFTIFQAGENSPALKSPEATAEHSLSIEDWECLKAFVDAAIKARPS